MSNDPKPADPTPPPADPAPAPAPEAPAEETPEAKPVNVTGHPHGY